MVVCRLQVHRYTLRWFSSFLDIMNSIGGNADISDSRGMLKRAVVVLIKLSGITKRVKEVCPVNASQREANPGQPTLKQLFSRPEFQPSSLLTFRSVRAAVFPLQPLMIDFVLLKIWSLHDPWSRRKILSAISGEKFYWISNFHRAAIFSFWHRQWSRDLIFDFLYFCFPLIR